MPKQNPRDPGMENYTALLTEAARQRDHYTAIDNRYYRVRKFIFYFLIALAIWMFAAYQPYQLWIAGVVIVALIVLLKLAANISTKIRYYTTYCDILERELAHKNSIDVDKYYYPVIDNNHPYAFDLDITGRSSLFNFISRCTTRPGIDKLAAALSGNILPAEKNILANQDAVKELSGKISWLVSFITYSRLGTFKEKEIPKEKTTVSKPQPPSVWICMGYFVFFMALLAAAIAELIPYSVLLVPIAFAMIILRRFGGYISEVNKTSDFQLEALEKYVDLIRLVENETFESPRLKELQQQLFVNNEKASVAVALLRKHIHSVEQASNVIGKTVMNYLYLNDLRLAINIHKWLIKYGQYTDQWFDAVAEMEVLVSLGIFTVNNTGFVFPSIAKDGHLLTAEDLSHPLLQAGKRVDNDFSITPANKLSIVTGANMAGKSTFLRTIGVNLVLAKMGCPVCASSFEFTPANLFTSMRSIDSLDNGISYFYAEILRLKQITEAIANSTEPYLLLLDEPLRGTNSKDKLQGSKLLLNKMKAMQQSVYTIIATHDLELTEMEREDPQQVKNFCFELKNEGQTLLPDYILRAGVSGNLNALELLRANGIV